MRMRSTGAAALAAGLSAGLLAGCGTQTATTTGAGTSDAPTAGAPAAPPPTPAPARLVTLHRVGGLPGLLDDLVVRDDGLATLSTRDGTRSGCRLTRDLLDRARAVPWAHLGAVGARTGPGADASGADRLDAFRYVIDAGGRQRVIDPGPGLPHDLAQAVGTAAVLMQAARNARTQQPTGCRPVSGSP